MILVITTVCLAFHFLWWSTNENKHMLFVQVRTFRHPRWIKGVFFTFGLIVFQPLFGAVLLNSLCCNTHTNQTPCISWISTVNWCQYASNVSYHKDSNHVDKSLPRNWAGTMYVPVCWRGSLHAGSTWIREPHASKKVGRQANCTLVCTCDSSSTMQSTGAWQDPAF